MGFVGNYIRNLLPVALGRQPQRPLLFSLYVTHRCALHCRYCCDGLGVQFSDRPVPELSTPDTKKLITILRRSADSLDITGGEPLLRDDLEDLLAHARQVGFRTVLNTKGIGLRERPDLMRLADVIVLGIDSLDAPKLAEVIGRPADVAGRILDALDFALATRDEAGTKLILSAVATPANLADIPKLLQFAISHLIGFHVSPEIAGTEPHHELRGNALYQSVIGEVIRAKRSRAPVLGVPEYLEGIRTFGRFWCHPLLMPVIRPDGRMYYPCLESARAEVSVLESGSYRTALSAARKRTGRLTDCGAGCQIFCHMALSLLQRRPLSALRELKYWGN